MLMDTRSLSALVERLTRERRVWVRLAASRPEEDWQLAALDVTIGDRPPTWRRQRWLYRRAAFIASAPAGKTVAGWLTRGQISLKPVIIRFEVVDPVHVERHGGRFAGRFDALPWPTYEWTVHLQGETSYVQHEELVASDAPVFFNFDQAAPSFFGFPPTPNRSFSGREIVIREQDQRARIDSVCVRPTEVVITVSGHELAGTLLTLGGDGAPRRRLSARTRKVRLPTPSGLGPGAWVALHRDQELLDRRILDASWGGKDFAVEVDTLTRVEVLINGGERANVEFKRQLPDSEPRAVMKTVAAFANGAGGTVLFGVENDGRVVGLGDEHPRQFIMDRLTNLITGWVRPLPDFRLEMVEVAGASVLALDVPPGNETPYGVGTNQRNTTYYVRRAGTTFPATPSDVRAVVQARLSTASDLRFRARRR